MSTQSLLCLRYDVFLWEGGLRQCLSLYYTQILNLLYSLAWWLLSCLSFLSADTSMYHHTWKTTFAV